MAEFAVSNQNDNDSRQFVITVAKGENDALSLDFSLPVSWISMPRQEAVKLAIILIKRAVSKNEFDEAFSEAIIDALCDSLSDGLMKKVTDMLHD